MRNLAILIAAGGLGLTLAATAAAEHDDRQRGWEGFSARHDVDGDGAVTRDELAATDPRFDTLDQDGDGVVTESDFDALRERARTSAAGRALRLADSDRDGVVSAGEWQGFLAAVDPDGDGLFEPADLRALAAERGGPGGRRFSRGHGGPPRGMGRHGGGLASALDCDQDGELEIADLDALFRELDADGDGALQEGELPAPRFRGRGRGPRGFGGPRGDR